MGAQLALSDTLHDYVSHRQPSVLVGGDVRQFSWPKERPAADRLAENNGPRAAEVAEHTISASLLEDRLQLG